MWETVTFVCKDREPLEELEMAMNSLGLLCSKDRALIGGTTRKNPERMYGRLLILDGVASKSRRRCSLPPA